MEKRFCDIEGCEKEAVDIKGWQFEDTRKVVKENTNTRILFHGMFSFKNHSTGFGGPPDLCRECALDMVKGFLSEVKNAAKCLL